MIAVFRQLLAVVLSTTLVVPTCAETKNIASDPNAVNGAASYVYDPVGNRTQKTSTIAGYPGGLTNYNANDQISTDSYDNDGNTTASNGVGYVYDFENRLVQAGGGISIVYDGDGNRVSKTVAGMTTTYLVDDQNPTGYAQVVYEAITGSTTFPRESSHTFTYGLERVLEIRNYQTQQSNLSQTIYFVYDGHGSVRALTDQTGTVTDTYDYDAFGNLLHSTGTTLNNYRFAGEQFDPDLHLYFNRARYLNVATGRFWNMDTFEGYLSDPSTLHKYTYCFGDSVNCVDPSGHDGDIISTAAYNAGNITIQSIQAVRYLQVLGAVGSLLIGYVAAPYIEDVFNKYKDRYVGFEYALAAALAEFWNHLRRWQSDPEWPKQGNHTIKIGIFSPALPPWTPVVTLFKGQLPLNLLAFRAKINLEVFEGGDAGRLCGIQYQIGQSTSGTGYFEFRADYMDYQDRSAPPKFGLHLHVNYVSNGERTKIDHMPF